MRIVVFTSNAIRHKFLANSLAKKADDALIISEGRPSDSPATAKAEDQNSAITDHFKLRYETEKVFFKGNDYFIGKTLPLLYKEASLPATYETVKNFKPDLMFVFGASIIREPLLSLLPPGRFINLHLGLSPYYRGSGTNFWPFVNKELEFVGSTILHIDAGIDTGDIIAHVRPEIEMGDTVHTVGCKVIQASVKVFEEIIDIVKAGGELNRVKQWSVPDERYYKEKDFNEEILAKYKNNLENGLIKEYIESSKQELKLVTSLKK